MDILVERVEVDGREAESGFAESLRRQLDVVSIEYRIEMGIGKYGG